MDKKTERYLERLAKQNATRDIADINRKKLRSNITERKAIQDAKSLTEDEERRRFFNDMRRREF